MFPEEKKKKTSNNWLKKKASYPYLIYTHISGYLIQ